MEADSSAMAIIGRKNNETNNIILKI